MPDIENELKRLLQDQEAAWNRGDSTAWAAAFSDDADFINIRGEVFRGRNAIAQLHARIFGMPFKGSQATISVRQLTEAAPGIVLLETDYEVTQFQFLPPGVVPTYAGTLRTRMKYLAVKQGEEWRWIAAQNTAVLPDAPRIS